MGTDTAEPVLPTLVTERHGPVGWIIFNRPSAGNAMDAAMMAALPEAWTGLDADPAIAAIVVTGTGRAFQTGLDMRALAEDPASLREASRRTRESDLRLTGWHLGVQTPTIAAVNGVCAGGGLHFVVDADLVIASRSAAFIDPHVSVGQVSAWEAIGLTRRGPATIAAQIVMLGRYGRIDAQRAYEIGLVGELVDPDELRPRAQRLGEWVAAGDRDVIRARRDALWRAQEVGLSQARGYGPRQTGRGRGGSCGE